MSNYKIDFFLQIKDKVKKGNNEFNHKCITLSISDSESHERQGESALPEGEKIFLWIRGVEKGSVSVCPGALWNFRSSPNLASERLQKEAWCLQLARNPDLSRACHCCEHFTFSSSRVGWATAHSNPSPREGKRMEFWDEFRGVWVIGQSLARSLPWSKRSYIARRSPFP